MKDYGPITTEDYWLSRGEFDHYTLPMTVQCRLFPRTTLGDKPLREPKGVLK